MPHVCTCARFRRAIEEDGRPATGNKLVFSTSDFFRIENGKIAERWDAVETLARAIALGLMSAPNAPAPTPLTPR
jgi:hypothetical protein